MFVREHHLCVSTLEGFMAGASTLVAMYVLDPVDALEETAGPIYVVPCVLGGGLNPGLAVLA